MEATSSAQRKPAVTSCFRLAAVISTSASLIFFAALIVFNAINAATRPLPTPGVVYASGATEQLVPGVLAIATFVVSIWAWLFRLPVQQINGRLFGLLFTSFILFSIEATFLVLGTNILPWEALHTARSDMLLYQLSLDPVSGIIKLLLAGVPAWLIYRSRGMPCLNQADRAPALTALILTAGWWCSIFCLMAGALVGVLGGLVVSAVLIVLVQKFAKPKGA